MLQILTRQVLPAEVVRLKIWDAERAEVDRWIDTTVVATVNGYRIREVPGASPPRFMLNGTGLVFPSIEAAEAGARTRLPRPTSVLSFKMVTAVAARERAKTSRAALAPEPPT